MPPDRVRVQPHFCGRCSQRCRAPLSYRQAQSSGSGVITAGIWIIKAGICVIIPLPRVIKAGTRFIKQPYKPQRPPEICPVFNERGTQRKITLSKTNALRTPHRSSQRVQEFSPYMPQMLAFVSIFSLLLKKTQVFFKNVIFRNVKFWQVFYYAPFSAPVCVTAPQINGEGTETLCITFLYKKRKITALNIKRLKRAFPFVLRGLVIFEYVGAVYF